MHTRLLTHADIPAVVDISDKAFIDAELNAWLYPHRREFPEAWRERIVRSLRTSLAKPGAYGFVCVTDDEDPAEWPRNVIVGYSWWQWNGPANDALTAKWQSNNTGVAKAVERTLMNWESRYVSYFQLDKYLSRERQALFDRENDAFGNPFAPLKSYWSLVVLGVHPEWQGRGVGKKLMQWGLDRSDEDRIPIVMIATVAGQRLYHRLGFGIANWAITESMNWARGGAIMVRDVEDMFTRKAIAEETTRDFFGEKRQIDLIFKE